MSHWNVPLSSNKHSNLKWQILLNHRFRAKVWLFLRIGKNCSSAQKSVNENEATGLFPLYHDIYSKMARQEEILGFFFPPMKAVWNIRGYTVPAGRRWCKVSGLLLHPSVKGHGSSMWHGGDAIWKDFRPTREMRLWAPCPSVTLLSNVSQLMGSWAAAGQSPQSSAAKLKKWFKLGALIAVECIWVSDQTGACCVTLEEDFVLFWGGGKQKPADHRTGEWNAQQNTCKRAYPAKCWFYGTCQENSCHKKPSESRKTNLCS